MTDVSAFLAAFGERLRALREERGMSRDDLAAAAETSVRRLEAVEGGREDPKYLLSLRLVRALDTTLGSITEGMPE
jgi:transcriptional regulator with XRE-family HTH domain